jgi:hypothetical protein
MMIHSLLIDEFEMPSIECSTLSLTHSVLIGGTSRTLFRDPTPSPR